MSLVLMRAPVSLEPIDQDLEGHVVHIVEVKAFGSDFDELLENFLFGHIAQYDILRVGRQDGEAVRNTSWLLLLLFLQSSLKIFEGLSVREFLMTDNFSNKTIAGNDVALDDFSQALKVVVTANH